MLIRLVGRHLRPLSGTIALLAVLQLVQTVANLLLPALNADIVDRGVLTGDVDHVLGTGAAMVTVALVQIGCATGAVLFGTRISTAVGRDLRSRVFRRVQTFSAREIGRFGTASLITRTTNDVHQVQTLVLMASALVVSVPVTAVGGTVLALQQDPTLSLLFAVVVPLLVVVLWLVVARMTPLYRLLQARLDRLNRVLREQIAGVRVVRAFVRDDHERARYTAVNDDLLDYSLQLGRLIALMTPAVMLVANAAGVAVIWFGGHRVVDGLAGPGTLIAYLGYLTMILMTVVQALFLFMSAPRAVVCAHRIDEVLRTGSSTLAPAVPVRPARITGRVELRGVGFRYPRAEEPVLRGVDLHAGPGELVAIVGGTGSGKTTLLNLMARLVDPTEGSLRLDGVDLRELDPRVLRDAVGLVPQRPMLFSGTIADNLRFGAPDATDRQLWDALEVAQAADFVRGAARGLDTPVGQAGRTLSGGQRQRLAIARTLLREPAVLLFDDSFSALDATTDAALRSALADSTAHTTVLVVAQRISTIRHADRIVVLDGGRAVAVGRHDELVAGSRTYRAIADSQATDRETA